MAFNASSVRFVDSTFHAADYAVFSAFLAVSGAVGVFFSLRGQRNTDDYFLGGRNMRPVPVGISLGVSFMSASSLVGLPAETFVNGYSYMLSVLFGGAGYVLGCVILSSVLQPQSLTSISEYLRLRFNSRIISFFSNAVVLLCILEYMGVCMLGSVIAFSSATGGQVSVVGALAIGCAVGVFYTTIGGMKAVVWSDVLQFGFMLVGIVSVIIKASLDTPGGVSEIVRLNVAHQRIHPLNWSFDLTVRHSVWGLVVGISVYWMAWCVQPAGVQRLCCTNSKRDANIVAGVASIIFILLELLPCWAGLSIFGFYASRGCDIVSAGWITNNEVVLYYVRERLSFPGFQGLFVAALYAGSLSSLSSGLNAASAILWKDTIRPLLKFSVSEARATLVSKALVVVLGVVSMLWCLTLHSFHGLLIQMAYTLDASMYGAYFGLLVFAIFVVGATWKGAVAGMLTGFAFTLWIGLGSLLAGKASGGSLPTVTHACDLNTTVTPANVTQEVCTAPSFVQTLYNISYEWLTLLCLVISLTSALMVIGCTGTRKLDEKEARLVVSWCRPKVKRERERGGGRMPNGKRVDEDEAMIPTAREVTIL